MMKSPSKGAPRKAICVRLDKRWTRRIALHPLGTKARRPAIASAIEARTMRDRNEPTETMLVATTPYSSCGPARGISQMNFVNFPLARISAARPLAVRGSWNLAICLNMQKCDGAPVSDVNAGFETPAQGLRITRSAVRARP